MKIGPDGLDIIKRNEGCRLTAYLDTVAAPPVWTIGYGDTLGVHEGMTITQDEADEGLAQRLANEFEPGVLAALQGAPATQSQFDAMVSLAWNIGTRGFARSSVARFHVAGNYLAAADAFRLWNKAGGKVIQGLVRRREEERALYLSQPATTVPPALDPQLVAEAMDVLGRLQTALAALG